MLGQIIQTSEVCKTEWSGDENMFSQEMSHFRGNAQHRKTIGAFAAH